MNRFPPIFIPKRAHTPDEQIAYITYTIYKNGTLTESQKMDPKIQAQIELGMALHREDEEQNEKVIPINIFEQRRMRKEFETFQKNRDKALDRKTDDYFLGVQNRNAVIKIQQEAERRRKNFTVLKDYNLKKDDK